MTYIGVAIMLMGALSPVKGSPAVLAGSVLISISTSLRQDPRQLSFLLGSILIGFGAATLWFVQSLESGQMGPRLPWMLLISPYPVGALTVLVQFSIMQYRRFRESASDAELADTV